jgi:type II secretory pathway pseudopilin PulG
VSYNYVNSGKKYVFAEPPNDGATRTANGFTLVEVIVAASIMIILCVGILSVFSYVTKINRGENLRMQALSVLQKEVEHYRSLKFVPGAETDANLPSHRAPELMGMLTGLTIQDLRERVTTVKY